MDTEKNLYKPRNRLRNLLPSYICFTSHMIPMLKYELGDCLTENDITKEINIRWRTLIEKSALGDKDAIDELEYFETKARDYLSTTE
jgi:hypothetical protein